MQFTIEHNGLKMQCRLFQRARFGTWVLSGYVNHEERMCCDVTVTIKAHRNNHERLIQELETTAKTRLVQIASE